MKINPFLNTLFNDLNNNNVKYIVLRNFMSLPYSTNGSDLDILINKSDLQRFIILLNSAIKENNGEFVSITDSETPRYCIMGKNNEKWWGVLIDLHIEEITHNKVTIISNASLWSNIEYHNGVCVLNDKTNALIGFLKELLNNKTCNNTNYQNFINFSCDEDFLKKTLSNNIGLEIVNSLLQLKNNNYSDLKGVVKTLHREIKTNKIDVFYNQLKKLKRVKNKPGYVIAFLGCDGAGKTTIIQKISPLLNEAFHKSVYYRHLRPNAIPKLGSLFGKENDLNLPITDPHGKKTSGFIGSLLRFSYYLIDYTFGYFITVFIKKSLKTCVFIFDRYIYDYQIDKKRTRVNLPKWILSIVQKVIPEPDLIICLGTDPLLIHTRKPETSFEEVKRQVAVLKHFSENHKNAVWIDTGNSIEKAASDVMEVIFELMKKRNHHI